MLTHSQLGGKGCLYIRSTCIACLRDEKDKYQGILEDPENRIQAVRLSNSRRSERDVIPMLRHGRAESEFIVTNQKRQERISLD